MKKTVIAVLIAAAAALPLVVHAEPDGHLWVKQTEATKAEEIRRILNNIKSRGCYVKLSADYYVPQINDFYVEPSTRNIPYAKALGLIATGAGEDWNC